MFFITYSEQIMHLSFALGAILISGAVTWLLFTTISIVRNIQHVIEKIKTTLEITHEVATAAKAKIHDFSIQFKAISSGLTTVLDWIDKRKSESVNKTKSQEESTQSEK